MNVNITGLHIPISDSLREYIEKKVRKLKKYNEKLTEADFTISVEKNNNIVKAKIYGKNIKYKCEERTNDMYDSINGVINKLEKRLRKIKTKKKDHSLKGFRWVEHQIFEETLKKSYKKDEEIVEVENFELKPMTIDEAIEQLKLNSSKNDKNNFIVFNDSETNKFSVLYINGKNRYGLIQPE